MSNKIAGEIHTVIAFRHICGFPERGRHRSRKDTDVLLCIDCLDDWVAAGADPYFADRVIEQGLIYLDEDGNEGEGSLERYVETVMFDEITPEHPQRCAGCRQRWDKLIGDRVIYPGRSEIELPEVGEDGTVEAEEISKEARRLAKLLEAIADSSCVDDLSFTVQHDKEEELLLILQADRAPDTDENAWRQVVATATALKYTVEELKVTNGDLPEGSNVFDAVEIILAGEEPEIAE